MVKSSLLKLIIPLILYSTFGVGKEPIVPINSNELPVLSSKKIGLGLQLYNEPLLSKTVDISCATCHPLSTATADGAKLSLDNQGNTLTYNTPSLDYVTLNYNYTWVGRDSTLAAHIKALVLNKKIFNSSMSEVATRLSTANYLFKFNNAGYEEINGNNITDALITFLQSLIAPSRFDLYLLGDKKQLSDTEIQGYLLFKDYGCVSCHQGRNIGGNLRQTIGVRHSYFTDENPSSLSDLGYYNITKKEYDKFSFRVPSLRNVAQTAPYFHNGSINTLKEAIIIMGYYQLGVNVPEEDILAIETFLKTLNKINE